MTASTSGAGGGGAPPVLEVEGLAVPFGDAPGLRDVSFTVGPGERFVLVGASGSGKTSLLRALAGTGPRTAGRIRVGGREVQGLAPEARGPVLLAQTPLLFPHLSVAENVAFPLRVRGLRGEELRRRVRGALEAVRMKGFGERRPATLSGGQARRVALARAVVARPPALLLDEPLSALDPALRSEVRRSIRAVHRDYGAALVLVTHDLEEAGELADRVGVLVGGTLAQVAPPGELFRRPASLEVARFLGLPNELPARRDADGALRVGPFRVPGAPEASGSPESSGSPGSSADGSGPLRAVFGRDGVATVGRIDTGREATPGAPDGDAEPVAAAVAAVRHRPEGAWAEVRLPDGVALQVAVDPRDPPEPGSTVRLVLRPGRIHLFPGG